jgi:radical SAM protein with 4Fe4S-binding SPASM domain
VATSVEELADALPVRLLWLPPVARSERPLREQLVAGPRCSGDVAVRVQPDGGVLPPRGEAVAAGNLLEQPWARIWEHAAFRAFRERVDAASRCPECPGLASCAAACPADPEGWAR